MKTVSGIIALIESGGDKYAVRFEPLHKVRAEYVSEMRHVANCSLDTAKILCACSWGQFQIMGDYLMQLGLNMSPLQFVHDDIAQDRFFAMVLRDKTLHKMTADDLKNSESIRRIFARKYNGPGNVDVYAEKLRKAAQ